MKKNFIKNFIRIAIIIFLVIIFYQNYCFADVAIGPTYKEGLGALAVFLIPIIGFIVLFVSIVSFFILRILVKRDDNNEKNIEKLKKKSTRIYILIIIFAIIENVISTQYILLEYYYMVDNWILLSNILVIILFIISIVLREKRRNDSNMICVITILLICIIPLTFSCIDKSIENYNETFKEYTSITELINLVSENNIENKNKITVVYNDIEYETTEELNILLNELDTNTDYYASFSPSNGDYITKITIKEKSYYYNYIY